MQLVARYGPAVDSGSGDAAAALWTEDGRFDAVPQRRMKVSANTWRWVRTPDGWRTTERVDADLDGTPAHREMLAPKK